VLSERVIEEIERFIEAYYECTYFDEELLMLREFLNIYKKHGKNIVHLIRQIRKVKKER